MAMEKGLSGSIVAFEGHAETISTQLRLLPTSPHILILPNVQCYVPNHETEQPFDARAYIKSIHEATLTRRQAAQDFLRSSTSDSKRLVFMNGGTPGAQALCIGAIMKHETNGDRAKAEAIFNHLVRDGVAGLEDPARDWGRRNTFQYWSEQQSGKDLEDPITRAMRAADALDRQTASLQPTNELDLTLSTRTRSNSLPLYGYADNFGDAAPFFVFGAQDKEDTDSLSDVASEEIQSPRTPLFAVTHYEKPFETIYPGFANLRSASPMSPRCTGESYCLAPGRSRFAMEVFTPKSDAFSIRSTDNVVYGQASLLDMRLSGRRSSLVRVKSLDRIFTATPQYRDLCIPSESAEVDRDADQDWPPESRRHSCMVITSRKDSLPSRLSYVEGPRTIMVRSNKSTIKVDPVPEERKRKPARTSYVDRGTDPEDLILANEPIQPVLALAEDLVIYFQDEVPDALLDASIKGFRAGDYPIIPHTPISPEAVIEPSTPDSQSISEPDYVDDEYEESDMNSQTRDTDEYDPFAYIQPTWPKPKPLRKAPTVRVHRPPTPAETLPPLVVGADDKVHEFMISSQQTAVAIQNSLRSVLKAHFPSETEGYCQFKFPLLPELEGLWRPIFREAEPGSPREDSRRMDQILAIGAQRGVKREYASAITGQLEKLGTKSSGMSRSGRLDFRYLLATAMQAYTAQPLTSQTHDNPFANSYLLATLIIPHLETYLILHSEVRFLLLEYPPEHLPTMLALQKLVGVDLMKVAQIVDSESKELLPFKHIRGASINNQSESGSLQHLGKSMTASPVSSSDITLSKANFLLTSNASDAEIATFISTVLKILSAISQFYIPEEPPKKPSPRKAKPSPLQGTFSPFPKVTSGPQSPSLTSPMTPRFGHMPVSPGLSSRAPSIAETVKTFRSSRSKHSQAKSRRKAPTIDDQSIMTADLSDSEWDMEDKRLMPTLIKRPEIPKGNSRKALKFLGLV